MHYNQPVLIFALLSQGRKKITIKVYVVLKYRYIFLDHLHGNN